MKHKFSKVFFVVVMLLVVCLLAVACNDGQDNDNNPVKYAVSYEGGNGATGTAPSGGTYAQGEKITLPSAGGLSKTNYTFGGWSYGGHTYAVGAEFTMPANAVVFTAVWNEDQAVEKYAVSYVGGDGAIGTAPSGNEYAEGAKVTLPGAGSLSKTDFTFGGWSYGGQTYAVGAEFTMPASAVVFTAVWNPIEYCTVTFNPNNVEVPVTWTETVIKGQTVAKPANDPVHENGKTFRYWTQSSAVFDFSRPINSDITLVAEFAWKVTFSAGEGTGTVEPMWVKTWGNVTLPNGTGLSNGNKVFNGWTDGTDNYKAGDIYRGSGNPTLTALWKEPEQPQNGYKLAFTAGGQGEGTAPEVQYKQAGDVITLPANTWFHVDSFNYPNYEFKGWSTSWRGTPLYKPGDTYTMPANDVTFQAIWDVAASESFTVTYKPGAHASGNDVVQTKDKNEGFYLRSLSQLGNPFTIDTDANWIHIGWKIEGDATNTMYYNEDEFVADKDYVFVAQWEAYTQMQCYDQSQNALLWLAIDSNGFGSCALSIWNPATQEADEIYPAVSLSGTTLKIIVDSATYTGTLSNGKVTIDITVSGTTYHFVNAEQATGPVVTFDANGGTGSAPTNVSIVKGTQDQYVITLPANTFTAPTDMAFKEWNVTVQGDDYQGYKAGSTVRAKLGEHVIIKAVWESTVEVPFEGIAFIGSCKVPTKTVFGMTTGGQTYVKFIINFDDMKIQNTTSAGTEKVVTLSTLGLTDAPDNYGSDVTYYECQMEDNIAYNILINADKTKLLLCDSNDSPLTDGEFTVSNGDSEWVVIDTSAGSAWDTLASASTKLYFEESFVSGSTTFVGIQIIKNSLGTIGIKAIYLSGTEEKVPTQSLTSKANADNPYLLEFPGSGTSSYKIILGQKEDGNYYVTYFSYKNDPDETERVLLTEKPEA